jgi:hypothetical protein
MMSRNRVFVKIVKNFVESKVNFFLSRLRSLSMSIVVLHAQCQKYTFMTSPGERDSPSQWSERHALMNCVV